MHPPPQLEPHPPHPPQAPQAQAQAQAQAQTEKLQSRLPMPKSRASLSQSGYVVISFFAVLLFLSTAFYMQASSAPVVIMEPVTHILLVSYKPSTPKETVQQISDQILAFKETCVDPDTKKPYILATKGGKNNSPEDSNKDMTHGFIVEFKSKEDRNYFLEKDPAHKKFVETIIPNNNDFLTLDFTDGLH